STVDIASQANKYQEWKNQEFFDFTIGGNGLVTAGDDEFFIVLNSSKTANGKYTVNFKDGVFKDNSPYCTPVVYTPDTATDITAKVTSISKSSLSYITTVNGVATDTGTSWNCRKRGTDRLEAFRSFSSVAIKESNIYYDRDEFHTDERDTGRKWSGKAIYKKCVTGSLATGTVISTNVERIVYANGSVSVSEGLRPWPYPLSGTIYNFPQIVTGGSLQINTNTASGIMGCVEYTKL